MIIKKIEGIIFKSLSNNFIINLIFFIHFEFISNKLH